VELGKSDVALDVLAQKGNWDKVWEVASKERLTASALGKYILMRVEEVFFFFFFVKFFNTIFI
jgi:hypothetical protein